LISREGREDAKDREGRPAAKPHYQKRFARNSTSEIIEIACQQKILRAFATFA
jgi:hypothetical protein